MQAIGFANKYYTLWSIDKRPNYTTDARGKHYLTSITYLYTYHKNISIDLEKAKASYPTLPVMEDLRGKTSSWEFTNKEEDLCPQIMKFGEYRGEDLNEIVEKDFSYVLWIVEQGSYSTNKNYAAELPKIKSHIEAKQKEEDDRINSLTNTYNKVRSQDEISFEATRNLSVYEDEAYITTEVDGLNVTLIFNSRQFNTQHYNGFTYGLPLLKGKAKRIKNKTLRIALDTEKNKDIQSNVISPYELYVKELIEVK